MPVMRLPADLWRKQEVNCQLVNLVELTTAPFSQLVVGQFAHRHSRRSISSFRFHFQTCCRTTVVEVGNKGRLSGQLLAALESSSGGRVGRKKGRQRQVFKRRVGGRWRGGRSFARIWMRKVRASERASEEARETRPQIGRQQEQRLSLRLALRLNLAGAQARGWRPRRRLHAPTRSLRRGPLAPAACADIEQVSCGRFCFPRPYVCWRCVSLARLAPKSGLRPLCAPLSPAENRNASETINLVRQKSPGLCWSPAEKTSRN